MKTTEVKLCFATINLMCVSSTSSTVEQHYVPVSPGAVTDKVFYAKQGQVKRLETDRLRDTRQSQAERHKTVAG